MKTHKFGRTLAAALALGLLLGLRSGHVAVFDGAGHCIRETEISASMLPEPDRRALEAGIPVRDQAALTALLEDFF